MKQTKEQDQKKILLTSRSDVEHPWHASTVGDRNVTLEYRENGHLCSGEQTTAGVARCPLYDMSD